ncbi:MAG: hypothetical protein QM658_11625 [Gordonia sp. (in: high G+C Gram-positive bacteria)]
MSDRERRGLAGRGPAHRLAELPSAREERTCTSQQVVAGVGQREPLTADNPQMLDYLHRIGGPGALAEVFLAVVMSYLGFAAATWAVTAVARIHGDETSGRTEVMLALPVARTRYLADQLGMVVAGVVVLLLAAGLLVGVGAGAVTGRWSSMVGDALAGAAVQIPAALVIGVGVVMLYAVAPRISVGGGWALVVAAFLLGPFGELFRLPQAVRDLSPFTHLPLVPSQPMAWTPVAVLLAVVVVFGAIGLARFARRPIG